MDYGELAETLKAIAHPTRLQILDLLRGGEICVCHIERALNRRQAYVSQQLMVLRDSGLVSTRKEGLQVHYSLADERLLDWLDVLLGAAQSAHIEHIAGCPCPHCSIVTIQSIR